GYRSYCCLLAGHWFINMLKHVWKPFLLPQLMSSRFASQKAQKSLANVNLNDELAKKGDSSKFDVDTLPKNATDNFLIEFKKRKPTYDQLFEYQIDEKPHLKSKPVSNSFLSPDFKIFL